MKINRNEYNYCLKNILEAIETSSGIYENNAFKVVAMSSLELMWDKLEVDNFYHSYDFTEEDYLKYFLKRTKEKNIDKYIHWVMFNSENEENQDEATK